MEKKKRNNTNTRSILVSSYAPNHKIKKNTKFKLIGVFQFCFFNQKRQHLQFHSYIYYGVNNFWNQQYKQRKGFKLLFDKTYIYMKKKGGISQIIITMIFRNQSINQTLILVTFFFVLKAQKTKLLIVLNWVSCFFC